MPPCPTLLAWTLIPCNLHRKLLLSISHRIWHSQIFSVGFHTQEGWYTSNLRKYLGLPKSKNKAEESPAAHAVDGICLATSQFMRYRQIKGRSGTFLGSVAVTPCPFAVISRPPICRRQLHLMIPSKGGLRRNYGGTISRHGFRKGDYVKAVKAGITYYGYVSGNTKTEVSVSNANWKRIGRFTTSKVQLLQRNTGLISTVGLSNLTTLSEVEVSGAV